MIQLVGDPSSSPDYPSNPVPLPTSGFIQPKATTEPVPGGTLPGPPTKGPTADQFPPGTTASGGQRLPGYTYDAAGNITGLPKTLGSEPGDKVTDVNGGLGTPGGTQTVIHTPPTSSSLFSSASTSQNLLDALNQAGAAPGSDLANSITKQYTDALGITGNPLQAGFSVGQYDPTRQKFYLPGTDLKYDNGQWGGHPYGSADASSGSAGNGLDLSTYAGSMFTDPATAYYENLLKQYSSSLQSAVGPFEDAATQRMKALQGPLYTNPQWDAVQTQTFDGLEQQRQEAIKNATQQLSALGHGSSSGTVAAAIQQVNAHYDQLRAQAQNTLQVQTFTQEQQRQDQAVQLAQAITNAVAGRKALDVQTGGMLADLPERRLQLAEQAFGSSNGPSSSLGSNGIQLLNSLNTQQQQQQAQREQFATGLGQYLQYILSGTTPPKTA